MNKDLEKRDNSLTAPKGRGFEEGINKEELEIPRAKLLQALSPEVQDDGLAQGLIINSMTKVALPEVFVPIFKFTNWIRFNPRSDKDPAYDSAFGPGDIIWRSSDPNDPKVIEEGKFGDDGSTPLATKFLNFFSYFAGCDMPVVISFSKTSFRAGKRLLSLAAFKGGDMFAHAYRLNAKKVDNDKGKYYVLEVAPSGPAPDEDKRVCEDWYETFRLKPITVHEGDKTDEIPE